MITGSTARAQPLSWTRALREAFRDLDELLSFLGLSRAQIAADLQAAATFPLLVPRGFAARMRHGDPRDPLLRQVLPLADELPARAGFVADPVQDLAYTRSPGLIHKYAGRVLLITTGSCAVHCRYCFRREFPYTEELAAREDWREAVATIAADPGIEEVILSGGDPLSLATHKLDALTLQLASLPQLRRLRIHTRWPVVLPERIDSEFQAWLRRLPWPTWMVIHANHPAELDHQVAAALARVRDAGVTLLNQSVLLRGVNDAADPLIALSQRLSELGVLPYYLNLLDPVVGSAHFRVGVRQARALVAMMRDRLPGYLVPRLVRDVPGKGSKTVLS